MLWLKKTLLYNKNPTSVDIGILLRMVPTRRLERLTYGLEGSCSIQLSYVGICAVIIISNISGIFKGYLCNLLYNSVATSIGKNWLNSSIDALLRLSRSGYAR